MPHHAKPALTIARARLMVLTASTALAAVTGCTLRGSGSAGSELRELDDFDRIDIGGAFTLTVHVDPDAAPKVELRGDDNILPSILTKVQGSELDIGFENMIVNPKLPLEVEVWVPALQAIDASGASTIHVEGIAGERFDLDLSGSAEVALAGAVERLDVDISGSAELAARTLVAERVEVELSGSGEAEVFASERLDADISGSAEVTYWGDPEVEKDISGSGKVEPGA
ncbi:DUF2807 domain-containing protein [Pseudenhygromyxa sp. WMMC2535]|uniref:head GIN domain-containing protein n=1 Tax=Pseudenhygromyxa sp. WMMC2535 TaxID=2712867 RepID=UPI0015518FBE|nr:head GIN domain-containing protein [Pseudenhygromyxa sp. WMMC2535]NVB38618.1 DUF2807 domain-containing protein [Pseudenhygromyxa sp. WMMC2535]